MYCLESVDNGDNLSALSLDVASGFELSSAAGLAGGSVQIVAKGWRRTEQGWQGGAYRPASTSEEEEPALLRFVPYHLWGNRGTTEMAVWVRRHGGS